MQISLYLLCFLQFGELKSANKLIFTVLFAIWRARQRDHSGAMTGKMENSLYLLCFLQFGELKSVKKLIFAAIVAMRRAEKCK